MTLVHRSAAGLAPEADTAAPAPARRDFTPLLALLPVLVTLCVSGYRAGRRQLWEDEYSTWHASTMTLSQLRFLVSHVDLVIEPYYLFMHYWIIVFGDSPAALRAPSVIAMSLSAGLLMLIGRRLFDTGTGVIAGVLFAAVPGISRYAQEARPYALAVFFATLATLLLLRALERPTWLRWLLYAVSMIAVGGTHIVALTVLAAHAIAVGWLAVRDVRDARWRRPWRAIGRRWWFAGAVALVVLVIAPFARAAHRESYAVAWITVTKASLRSFPADLFGSQPIAEVTIALAVIAAIILLLPGGDRHAPVLLGAWALVPAGVLLATVPQLHLFFYRYLLFIVPAWVLLAARGLDGLFRTVARGRARAVAVTLVLAAIGVLSVPGQQDIRQRLLPGSPDYSGVAAAIAAHLRPGDGIAYGGYFYKGRRALTNEMRDWRTRPRDVFLAASFAQTGSFVARECTAPAPCLGGTTRIWLVETATSPGDFAEMPAATADLLASRFTVAEDLQLYRARLLLLTAKPGE
jgi:mannosyltransferase